MINEQGISIIIVNWNGEKWLKKLFDSISSQSYQNFEVIFVDNGSSDDSVAYLKTNYPGTYIIENNRNLGFASGCNIGITKVTKPYIMLLNTDTWIEPNFIELLQAELHNRKLDVIAPQEANYETGKQRKPYVTLIDFFGHPIFMPKTEKCHKSFYLSGVCLLFSRKVYEESGGLDDSFFMYCEEVDWFWRLKLYGYAFDYSDKVSINHYGGGSSKKGLNENVFLWRNENTLRMLIKNWGKLSLLLSLAGFSAISIVEMVLFVALFKPKISITYIKAWKAVVANRRLLYLQRREVQMKRLRSDSYIRDEMYPKSAKLHHLFNSYRREKSING